MNYLEMGHVASVVIMEREGVVMPLLEWALMVEGRNDAYLDFIHRRVSDPEVVIPRLQAELRNLAHDMDERVQERRKPKD